jgi:hypothetical protein
MVMPALGELREVDVRELWQHEERDFTPWLMANKHHLERALGVDIELDEREQSVGPFELDIIGRKLADNSVLLVENQLGGSDHRHLGQLLTYAGGVSASTVVWIATSFNEQHRSALEWLNDHTAESVGFFGIELRAIRIDESRPAPIFDVVVRPNDWERSVAAAKSPGLSKRQELYRSFWSRYLDVARERGWTTAQSAQPQSWIAVPSGLSGLGVNAAFGGQRLAAELYFSGSDGERNLRRMRSLQDERERFEQHYGAALEWQDLEGRLACRIVEYLEDADILDEDRWDEYLAWVIDRHTRLRRALDDLGGPARAVGEA